MADPEGGHGGTAPHPLKYKSVHMCDQNFSKTPLNKFVLPDENHPKRVHVEEKVTLNKFLTKYPFTIFFFKITHPNDQVVYIEIINFLIFKCLSNV